MNQSIDSNDTIIKICSFCGKSETEVEKLFTKNNMESQVFICSECVTIAFRVIIANRMASSINELMGEKKENVISDFKLPDFTPKEIKAKLDNYIIGQEHAKRLLATAVFNHKKRIEYNKNETKELEISKSNILIIGPTGSGKTLMANTIAKILNVPYASCDATGITETGYVGEDAEICIKRLLQDAGGNPQKAEQGIVCVDEVDKIARRTDSGSGTRDVSGEGVQQAFLKILDGVTVYVSSDNSKRGLHAESTPVKTDGILFICCGAFTGLIDIIDRRLNSSSIGFGATIKRGSNNTNSTDILKLVEPEDLVAYGLIYEFIARLHIICVLDELDEPLLVRILTEPKNALTKQYQKLFELDNRKLTFTEDALSYIAQLGKKRKSGARALRSIIENLLYDEMFDVENKGDLIVDKVYVENKLSKTSNIINNSQNRGNA